MNRLVDFGFVTGLALVVTGVSLVHVPAGLIVAGVGLASGAWLADRGGDA